MTFFHLWHYNKTMKGLRTTQKGPRAGSVVNMKKLSIEEKIILQIALANFVQSRQDAKENSYIPREYLDRDIKIAQDLQEKITYFID